MLVRRSAVLAWVVVVAVAAALVRACGGGSPPEPPASDAPAPADAEADAAPPPPSRARTRVHTAEPRQDDEPEPGTVDAPPGPLVDGDVGKEHRGVGEETLDLFLLDAATDELVHSRVRLWRLGVPADDRWPEGDHIQDELHVAGSKRVEQLPAGRYRLEVWAAAPGTEDPPEFVVAAGQENTLRARIELPGEVPLGLRVYDEVGALVETATRRSAGTGTSWGAHAKAPGWARPRALRDPDSTQFGGGGGSRSLPRSSFSPVEALHGVFELGAVRRSGTNFEWSRHYWFRFPDRTEVRVRARSADAEAGRTYVAVTVPPQPLLDAVRFPDGTPAAEAAGANVEIECEAVAVLPGDQSAWRTVPIQVTFELADYETLQFTWCVADGTPQPRTLKPSAAAER